jgi:hypothetical protein
MFAAVGDHLIIRGTHVGERLRDGEILEVPHSDGGPPYRVRWEDTGRESLIFPGPDATIHHFGPAGAPAGGGGPRRP